MIVYQRTHPDFLLEGAVYSYDIITMTRKRLLFFSLFGVTPVILCTLLFMNSSVGSRTQLPNQEVLENFGSSQYQPHHFVIRNGFTLPMSQATLPIHILIRQQWMEDLRKYLYKKVNPNGSSPINIVSSDFKSKDILLNWLISATVKTKPPLRHILVLTLDQPLHRLLVEHDIDSLYIDPKTLLIPNILNTFQASRHIVVFKEILVMRFVVMRLINHWGYDVANYDIDAIILRNPNELFYHIINGDLIGSRGIAPEDVFSMFGVTMCAGAFMIKSNPKTEIYWKTLSSLPDLPNMPALPEETTGMYYDDQQRLNIALSLMNLTYNKTIYREDKIWVGRNAQGFTATILPEALMCRQECRKHKEKRLYVWHDAKGGKSKKLKIKSANLNHVWYLRKHWAQKSTMEGKKWLLKIKND